MLIAMQAYGNSKAAQIMFGEHLAREIESRGANVKIIRLRSFGLMVLSDMWLAVLCFALGK